VRSTSAGGGQTTSAGGGQTTSSGGGQTTSSGGGQTTSSGGGTSTTSGQANGFPATIIPYMTGMAIPDGSSHIHGVTIDTSDFDHWHTVSVSPHTHTVSDHTHSVSPHTHQVSDHTHTVSPHTHEVELDPHTHPIEHGIFLLDTMPDNIEIRVDGNLVSFSGNSADAINLIPYLNKASDGKVARGKHVVSLTPNERGRINAQINTQFFIQSRGQYTL